MADPQLDALVSRRVTYRYRKHTFSFDLSQALFSSAGVDSGTHLLLATIAEELDPSEYDRIADIGCGTGTLGIALAGSAGCDLLATDRDALAVAFTRRNAALNGVSRLDARASLTVPEYPGSGRELVVSNLPAKVGAPVLSLLVAGVLRRASLSSGTAGFVIVRPLADFLSAELDRLGGTVVARRSTANHAVTLVRSSVPPDDGLRDAVLQEAFIREHARFPGPKRPYELDTVYNIADFDRLSYRLALAFDLLRGTELAGPVALYGCGQGHLLSAVAQRATRSTITVGDRDLLALCATRHNSQANGIALNGWHLAPTVAAFSDALEPQSVAWFIVDDDPTPGSNWTDEVRSAADRTLAPEGKLLLVSRSTSVSRFRRDTGTQFTEVSDRRMHGFRASALRLRR